MTRQEAVNLITDYYYNDNPTEEDKFLFVEAQLFLIHTFHNPSDMHNLAWFYLEERRFDLEVRYLEMAAEYGYVPAIEELGYIWYYGQTGTVDYKKAFEYFSKGVECGNDISASCCEYKLADMYHNGYYVEKDEEKYRSMMESIYKRIHDPERMGSLCGFNYPSFPDIAYRLSGIRAEQGETSEAVKLLKNARRRLCEDIRDNPNWWGNIELMDDVVTLMHELEGKADRRPDIYDLFWMAREASRVVMLYDDRRFIIDIEPGEDGDALRVENKWYKDPRDFFEKAQIDGKKIVYLYDEFYDMEVCDGRTD